MDAPAPMVTIRPSKADARRPLIAVSRGRYFTRGGFTVSRDTVRVQARSGRVTEVDRDAIRGVVLTDGPRGDSRVLLTDGDGAVLAQDQSNFYSDTALRDLAAAVGCSLTDDPHRSFAAVDRRYPGTLRFRWERYPTLTGLALGVLICGPIVVIGVLTH